MADGKVVIETDLDASGIKAGLSKLSGIAQSGIKGTLTAIASAGTALAGLGGAAIKVGMDFESAFAGVKKTVDATPEQLEQIRTSLLNLSKQIPLTATEIAGIAEAAGQLGIKTENIEKFTRVMADMGVATNLTSDEAATSLARLANITGMSQDNFDRLGSVIVALGNNLATTESEIVEMGLRLAGAGKQIGLSESQIMSFAGALSSVGIEAEAGGSAFSTLMVNMQLACETGSDKLQDFASVAGMSADEFKESFEKDASEAILTFVQGLATCDEKGMSAVKVLDDMGIKEIRLRDALLRASGASDVFSESLRIGTDAWEENNALAKEAEQRYETTESKIILLKNSLSALGTELYDSVNTPIRTVVDSATSMVEQLTKAFKDGGLSGLVSELGTVFAEVATQAANSAPKMIDAATSMITSFLDGISRNSEQIAEAAVKIGESLISGITQIIPRVAEVGVEIISSLASNLLVSDVGKSVGELGKTIIDSFKTIASSVSGALNSLKPVFSTFISTVSKIAKTVIPPLTKVIEICISALKPMAPILTAAASGFAALKIVQTATSWIKSFTTSETLLAAKTTITNALLWAKIAATEVLTGKITLAQAAQQLWNVAMRSNPIGAVVTAIGVFVGALAGLVVALSGGKSETEQLNESFEKVSQGFTRFSDGMSNAKSHLSDFNSTLFASSEEQQALADNMQDVQNGITLICKTASAERRDYTQEEIQQLEQYFEKLRELNEQQLAIEQSIMDAVVAQAERQAEALDTSAKEYEQAAYDWLATTQEQAEKQISIIEEQCNQEIALLQQKHTQNGILNEEAFNADIEAAEQRKEARISAVQSEVASLYEQYSAGYGELTGLNEWYTTVTAGQNASLESENQRHADRLAEIENTKYSNVTEKENAIAFETNRHNSTMTSIWNDLTKNMTDEQLEQLAVWLGFVSQTELYGGQLDEKTKSTVEGLIASFDKLPQESRDTMKDALSPMLDEMNKKEPVLFAKATSIANGILGNLRKAFDIHSPSRKVRAIFNQVMEGAEKGLEDDTPKLLGQATSISNEFLDRLKNIDVTALMDQARAAVYSNQMAVAGAAARSNYMINTGISQSTSSGGDRQTVINFNQPVESPDATARAINRIFTFGLAGDKG